MRNFFITVALLVICVLIMLIVFAIVLAIAAFLAKSLAPWVGIAFIVALILLGMLILILSAVKEK